MKWPTVSSQSSYLSLTAFLPKRQFYNYVYYYLKEN